MSPSCRSSAIHTSDCAHVSCLLLYSSPSPLVLQLGFMRPKNAGFPAAGVGMWWVGPVARSLYVFENPSGVFTNKARCLWIALFSFHVFHRLCVVFDVLTYMCLLTEPVGDCAKSSKLSDLFVVIMSHFLHMFMNPQPVFCLPSFLPYILL